MDAPPGPPPNPGSCGSCSLCCTVMKVEMPPEEPKPWGKPCQHLCSKGPGCSIYRDRPVACRDFECFWLTSQRWPALALPSGLRPDRCGVVVTVNSSGSIIVHCQYPASWKRSPIREWLVEKAAQTIVIIDHHGSDDALLLNPDGQTDPIFFLGIDPTTNNRLYGHVAGGAPAAGLPG